MTRPMRVDVRGWVREKVRDPVFWADVTQLVKTVAAAVLAWVVATSLLALPQSFLAPWSALLVVHATVYRTFNQGVRQVGAAVLGVVLAWAIGNALGLDPFAVAVVLTIGLALGALPWFEGQSTTVATTALIVLVTGFSDNDNVLLSRLADTGIGIAVGLLVNLAVWPPLRRRTAIVAMDALDGRVGELLVSIADDLCGRVDEEVVEGWVDRTRELDEELEHAWWLVRQARESARLNPRRSAHDLRDPRQWISLLHHLEQGVAEMRSMAGTIGIGLQESSWSAAFRDGFVALLRDTGAAVTRADAEAVVGTRRRLEALVEQIGSGASAELWPVYGGLIINLRNILASMEDVARANPMSQPPLPFRVRRSTP